MAARSTRVFTLVFVHTPLDMQSGHRVLLGFKNRGFAAGTWTNFGGKVEGAESLEAAALRGESVRCCLHRCTEPVRLGDCV